ncbi:MAG: hypothetical protein QOJ96_1435 [Alphaproteobacteria bacterium]|nr:hypothetical protein [Alphaproteobacteria bacterium]
MENKNNERSSRFKRALGWLLDSTHVAFSFVWIIAPAFFVAWMAFSSDHKLDVLEAIHHNAKELGVKIERLTEIGEKVLLALNASQRTKPDEQEVGANALASAGKTAPPCDCTVDAFDPEFQGFGGHWPADWPKPKAQPRRAEVVAPKAVRPTQVAHAPRRTTSSKDRTIAAGDDRFTARTEFDF